MNDEKQNRSRRRLPLGYLMPGLILAAFVAGWGMANANRDGNEWPFPVTDLHASATASSEQFSVATGPISEDAEGLFVLDAVTGDLQCVVMSPRFPKFNAVFHAKPAIDLGIEQGKKSKYLLVTGVVNFRGSRQARPALSVAYVLDASTGKYVAYGIPYSLQKEAQDGQQAGNMVVLAAGSMRSPIASVGE